MLVDKVIGTVMECVELKKDGSVYGYEYRLFQPGQKSLISVRTSEANGVKSGQTVAVRGRVAARVWNNTPQLSLFADEIKPVSGAGA